MNDSDRPSTRGSELLVGLLVVAFIVFLLWFVLLRPRDSSTPVLETTPVPSALPTPVLDQPDAAFEAVIATPMPEPTPTATPEPRATPTPTPLVYTVQPGDTLSAIANRFGVTVDDLVRANRLVDPDQLEVGQQLSIPQA